MAKKIVMINENGEKKMAKEGFSWIIFFWGALGVWLNGNKGGQIALSFFFPFVNLYYIFKINENHKKDLQMLGFKEEIEGQTALQKNVG